MTSVSNKIDESYNKLITQLNSYTKAKTDFEKVLKLLSVGLKEITLHFKYNRSEFEFWYKAHKIIDHINPDNLENLTTKYIIDCIIKNYPDENLYEQWSGFIDEKLIESELNQLKINIKNFK